MLSENPKEYKTIHYKTCIDKIKFKNGIEERCNNNSNYHFIHNEYPDGLFFKIEKGLVFGLFKSVIEGTFSQRKDYSLLSMNYYSPKVFKFYHGIVLIIIILIAGVLTVYNLYYPATKLICLALLISISIKDILEYITYTVEKKAIINIIRKDGKAPEKIGKDMYHSLL